MKFSDYFQIKQCEYAYLKLIPISSTRNNANDDIISIINKLYKSPFESIKIENKCIKIYAPSKVSLILDMQHDECSFYLIVPKNNINEFQQKLTEIFGNITIEQIEEIPPISDSCTKYSMEYVKDHALSIVVNRKDNNLLSSNMSVMNILEEDDRVAIVYNFLPSSEKLLSAWKNYHVSKMTQYQQGNSLDNSLNPTMVKQKCGKFLFDVFDLITNLLQFAMGNDEVDNKDVFKRLVPMQKLTEDSIQKEKTEIIRTQIMLLSTSNDKKREVANAKTLVNSFSIVAKDNKFIAKRVDTPIGVKKKQKSCGIKKKSNKMKSIGIKKSMNSHNDIVEEIKDVEIVECKKEEVIKDTIENKFDFAKYSLRTNILMMGKEEAGTNCFCLPGKTLINQYHINSVKHNQTIIPDELIGGKVRHGINTYRGKDTVVTTSKNEDANCMSEVWQGKSGAGKSSLLENKGIDIANSDECLIAIDFIKICELSDNIMRNIDKSKCVVIDFADYMCQEAFSFNEIDMIRDMNNPISRYTCAGLQSSAIRQFVESLNSEDFSASMGRYLDAACSAVLIHPNKSIRDIMTCLTNHVKRVQYLNQLIEFKNGMPEEYQELIEEDIVALEELNEYAKPKKKSNNSTNNTDDEEEERTVTGTVNSKISGIVSRISQLKGCCPSLKLMYIRKPKHNINLTELMQQGKCIFFKIPQDEFSTIEARNIIVSYLFSKIEIAGIVRAKVYRGKRLTTVNVMCDEVHQAKNSFNNIERMCTEIRKFRIKLILTTHGFHKIAPIKDTLIEAGVGIFLLRGSSVKNFEVMKDEFEKFGFTPDDLVALSHCEEYKALCLIPTQKGRYGCIVRLPDPVKNKIELQEIS